MIDPQDVADLIAERGMAKGSFETPTGEVCLRGAIRYLAMNGMKARQPGEDAVAYNYRVACARDEEKETLQTLMPVIREQYPDRLTTASDDAWYQWAQAEGMPVDPDRNLYLAAQRFNDHEDTTIHDVVAMLEKAKAKETGHA